MSQVGTRNNCKHWEGGRDVFIFTNRASIVTTSSSQQFHITQIEDFSDQMPPPFGLRSPDQ